MSESAWGIAAGVTVIALFTVARIAVVLIQHRISMAKIAAEHRGWIRGFDEGIALYRNESCEAFLPQSKSKE